MFNTIMNKILSEPYKEDQAETYKKLMAEAREEFIKKAYDEILQANIMVVDDFLKNATGFFKKLDVGVLAEKLIDIAKDNAKTVAEHMYDFKEGIAKEASKEIIRQKILHNK